MVYAKPSRWVRFVRNFNEDAYSDTHCEHGVAFPAYDCAVCDARLRRVTQLYERQAVSQPVLPPRAITTIAPAVTTAPTVTAASGDDDDDGAGLLSAATLIVDAVEGMADAVITSSEPDTSAPDTTGDSFSSDAFGGGDSGGGGAGGDF